MTLIPSSELFRYPEKKDGEKSLPDWIPDLDGLNGEMEEVGQFLEGIEALIFIASDFVTYGEL